MNLGFNLVQYDVSINQSKPCSNVNRNILRYKFA